MDGHAAALARPSKSISPSNVTRPSARTVKTAPVNPAWRFNSPVMASLTKLSRSLEVDVNFQSSKAVYSTTSLITHGQALSLTKSPTSTTRLRPLL